MSGPKLIELRRMRAAAERQRNHDRCAGYESEYNRWLEQFRHWSKRLAELALPVEDHVRPLEQVRADMQDRLRQEFHHEAARLIGEEVARVQGLVEKQRSRFQERLATLQNRHRQLQLNAGMIAAARKDLENRLGSVIPGSWPATESDRIRRAIQNAMQGAVSPEVPAAPDNPDAIAQLEKSESIAALALTSLQQADELFTKELKETHARLLAGSVSQTAVPSAALAEILQRFSAPRVSHPADDKSAELNRLMAELAAAGGGGYLQIAREKAREARAETDAARRRVLTEALLIDLAARVKDGRELQRWREEVKKLIDSAAHLKDDAIDRMRSELRGLAESDRPRDLEPIRARMQAALDAAEARREREFRRKALLDSLKELGYETREGMETAFVKEGRVVLHRPDHGEYAVEMVANPELNQLQTALVRLAEGPEVTEQQRRRDREQEENWCADHGRLREKMAERGVETQFRMQLKPGEHPVKVIVDQDRTDSSRARAADQPARRFKPSPGSTG